MREKMNSAAMKTYNKPTYWHCVEGSVQVFWLALEDLGLWLAGF